MELEGSLPHSQDPATCPYTEAGQSSPYLPTTHSLKIHFNIILLSMAVSSKWSPTLKFPHQNPVSYPPPLHATCPAHLIFLSLITQTEFVEEYRSLSSSLCSLFHSPVTSSLFDPNILLNTLFSNALSLCSSLNVCDQVSHPYKKPVKIIVLYVLIFIFLDTQLQDKRFCTER